LSTVLCDELSCRLRKVHENLAYILLGIYREEKARKEGETEEEEEKERGF
jgi:hypothetical protein